ncbi:uncharacterized protein [Nicotiana sylvestris]|uniref:uncharacterized protein n=1 Tax=Nicotiana sylvestris TaxID=4096 RepID=UPI00388C89CC
MTQEGTYGIKKLTLQNTPKSNNQMSKNQISKEAIISVADTTPNIQMSSSSDEEEEVPGSEYELGKSDSENDEDSSGVKSRSYERKYKSIEEGPFSDGTCNKLVEAFTGHQVYVPNISQAFIDITDRANLSLGDKDFVLSVLYDGEQQLTCSLESEEEDITITNIYAKRKVPLREPLWEELRQTYSNHMKEWMVMGDFNCIIELSEKIGGNPHRMEKSLPLIECMTDCELNDLGYIGSTYTWCNLRTPSERICQRLDRTLANQEWLSKFPNTTVTLLEIVQQAWQIQVEGSPMWKFHLKLKNTYKNLSWWSKNSVGDIFALTNGKERRRQKLKLSRIKNDIGIWIEEQNNIGQEAVKFFENLFTEENLNRDLSLIQCLPSKVTSEDNDILCVYPTIQELKEIVFDMSFDIALGPNGMSRLFYHHCWDIIAEDLHNMILDFFNGSCLPRSILYSYLILVPKVKSPQEFFEMRPIRLSNFSCKIISTMLNSRLSKIINNLVSHNQTSYMNGRSIT